MAEQGYTLSGRDFARMAKTVKEAEAAPARRPVSPPHSAIVAPARVVLFEVVSGPTAGVYQVKILQRLPDATYPAISSIEVPMEDINEV